MGNHLHERLMVMDLDKNGFEHLFSVKRSLVASDELDLEDSRKCLNLVRSPRIRGGTTRVHRGLRALVSKEWFGTVDRCVLESWSRIESLPEKQRIGEIRAGVEDKERLERK
jgi:hypothetical protein